MSILTPWNYFFKFGSLSVIMAWTAWMLTSLLFPGDLMFCLFLFPSLQFLFSQTLKHGIFYYIENHCPLLPLTIEMSFVLLLACVPSNSLWPRLCRVCECNFGILIVIELLATNVTHVKRTLQAAMKEGREWKPDNICDSLKVFFEKSCVAKSVISWKEMYASH